MLPVTVARHNSDDPRAKAFKRLVCTVISAYHPHTTTHHFALILEAHLSFTKIIARSHSHSLIYTLSRPNTTKNPHFYLEFKLHLYLFIKVLRKHLIRLFVSLYNGLLVRCCLHHQTQFSEYGLIAKICYRAKHGLALVVKTLRNVFFSVTADLSRLRRFIIIPTHFQYVFVIRDPR